MTIREPDCREVLTYYITMVRKLIREYGEEPMGWEQAAYFQDVLLDMTTFGVPELTEMLLRDMRELTTLQVKRDPNADVKESARGIYR